MIGLAVVLIVVIGLGFLFLADRGKNLENKNDSFPISDVIHSLKKLQGGIPEKIFQQLKSTGPGHLLSVLEFWPEIKLPVQKELIAFWRREGFISFYMNNLGAKKEEDRLTAVRILTTIGDPEMIPGLVADLQKPAQYLPARVAEVLFSFGSEAVGPLVKALPGLPEGARCLVIDILAELGDERAVPALAGELVRKSDKAAAAGPDADRNGTAEAHCTAALDDVKADEAKRKAASALGEIGSIQAEESLLFALHDEDWGVRSRAAKALGQIRSLKAVPELRRALDDPARWVRTNAGEALRILGAEEE